MKRSKDRIDYKKLNSTGERKILDPVEGVANISTLHDSISVDEMTEKEDIAIKSLYIQFQSVSDDISDFIEENQLDEADVTNEDVIANLSKVEALRSKYRTIFLQLQATVAELNQKNEGITYQKIMNQIKEFIKSNKILQNLVSRICSR